MPDEMVIGVVTPGSPDDPFTQQASDAAGATSPPPAGDDGAAQAVAPETAQDGQAAAGAAAPTGDGEDGELTPEEEAALDALMEQIRAEVQQDVLPKVQSSYDRRIAALERKAEADARTAEARVQALQEEVRQAKLVGLTADEQARLKAQWSLEDEQGKLDAYRAEVEAYHKEVYIADCLAQYGPDLGVTAEDLAQFESPDEIESYIKDLALAHYRDLAASGGAAPAAPASAPAAKPAAAPSPSAPSSPAGLDAPTDAGGGAASPAPRQFDPRPGKEAMAANINGGWETVTVR